MSHNEMIERFGVNVVKEAEERYRAQYFGPWQAQMKPFPDILVESLMSCRQDGPAALGLLQ